ncbi:hypothetical protein [Streptomyces griseorubiginosus]|uniref:hypothetical protein n=1 Tax=Streptomyces griseorubiginosus TaxID=67304 RepID=UPI00331CCD40
MTDTPPPQAFDYEGAPLNVGDRVAFIAVYDKRPALYTGTIALIDKAQVCVKTHQLRVIPGTKWTPHGQEERMRYETIMRKPDTGTDS